MNILQPLMAMLDIHFISRLPPWWLSCTQLVISVHLSAPDLTSFTDIKAQTDSIYLYIKNLNFDRPEPTPEIKLGMDWMLKSTAW